MFTTRDFIFHDGRALRRFSIAGRTQAAIAGLGALTLGFSAYGVTQAAAAAIAPDAAVANVDQMRAKVARMQADVAAVKAAAAAHAARVEQRQALIAAVLSGKGDPEQLAAQVPTVPAGSAAAIAAEPFKRVEARQLAFAEAAQKLTDQRVALTTRELRRLGLSPSRIARTQPGAMGGPLEAVPTPAEAATAQAASDAQFRALFQSWKKLDSLEQAVISIPSAQPVSSLLFTSNFGVRSDPFKGVAAMHAGVDIPGPLGTPVYATADGVVGRAERAGGYGNLIEVNHGKGIETRYGHLSKILVSPNTKVTRGQLIGLMGSTGRSTGSHLHYEVRIDGRAVNPVPYLQVATTMHAIEGKALKTAAVAMGGPAVNR